MIKSNVELYGYNSSTEIKYHYQSYLFGIQSNSIYKFLNLYNSKKHLLNGWNSVVVNLELELYYHFLKRDCFLNLGIFKYNLKKNITNGNTELFKIIYNAKLFPILKVKNVRY